MKSFLHSLTSNNPDRDNKGGTIVIEVYGLSTLNPVRNLYLRRVCVESIKATP